MNMIHTLNLNGGKQQSQSNSCDDLVSKSEVAVLSQQNQSNPAFEPVTQWVNASVADWNLHINKPN